MIDPREKPLLRALNGNASERPPFWYMRQAGRYLPEYRSLREKAPNFLTFCYTPELAIEATLQPLRRFHMDAAILFSDILVIPDALGQAVSFREGEGPVLEPIRTRGELVRLGGRDVLAHLEPVLVTVRGVRQGLPQGVALIGFAGAPWTVATYMVEGRSGADFVTVKRWSEEDPEGFGQLIDLLVEATGSYLLAQIEAGAEAIQLFDSWAGVLSPQGFERWVIEPTSRLVSRIKERFPDTPVIGFPRGAGKLYEPYVLNTGVDAVGLDSDVSLDFAVETLQSRVAVQGNLSPVALLEGGKEMEDAATHILSRLSRGPFVFNLGHGITPATPPEHVARLSELVRSWPRL